MEKFVSSVKSEVLVSLFGNTSVLYLAGILEVVFSMMGALFENSQGHLQNPLFMHPIRVPQMFT